MTHKYNLDYSDILNEIHNEVGGDSKMARYMVEYQDILTSMLNRAIDQIVPVFSQDFSEKVNAQIELVKENVTNNAEDITGAAVNKVLVDAKSKHNDAISALDTKANVILEQYKGEFIKMAASIKNTLDESNIGELRRLIDNGISLATDKITTKIGLEAKLQDVINSINAKFIVDTINNSDELIDPTSVRGLAKLEERIGKLSNISGNATNNNSIVLQPSGKLSLMDDVNMSGIEEGNVLVWNASTRKMEPGVASGGDVSSVNGYTGDVVLNKGDIGLGDVENTSDSDKPISDATQAALDNKADVGDLHSHSNKTVLDKFGENGEGKPTYNGNDVDTTIAQRDVYDGLDSTDNTISLSAKQGKVLKDVQDTQQTDIDANSAERHGAVTVTDSAEIDFTLTGQDITAELKAGSIDENKLDTSVNASLNKADTALQDITNENLGDLSDVDTSAQANGKTLTYNSSTNKWEAQTPATGVTDHGLLTGLGDDDHTQYHNDSRADTWLGGKDTDDLDEGAINLYYPSADKTKLAGIEDNAEVNNISDTNATDLTDGGDSTLHYHSSDRDRAHHTGTQTASTISDFDTEVSNNTDVSDNTSARHSHSNKTVLDNTTASFTTADEDKLDYISVTQAVDLDQIESDTNTNNAKVSNATHTGEVTGSGALTVDVTAISNKTAKTVTGSEEILVNDGGTLKKTTAQSIADLVDGGGADYILIQDQKSSGTNGGSRTSGSWLTETLNTEVADSGGNASLASNVVTLNAGTYEVRAFAMGTATKRFKTRLRNTSDNSTIAVGSSAYSYESAGWYPNSVSEIVSRFTLNANKNIELQYFCENDYSNGRGYAVSSGEVEVYAQLELHKVA